MNPSLPPMEFYKPVIPVSSDLTKPMSNTTFTFYYLRAGRRRGIRKLSGNRRPGRPLPGHLLPESFLIPPLHAATAAKRKGRRPLSLPGGLPGYTKSRGHHTLPGFHSKKRLSFPGMLFIPSTTILILLPTSARTGIIRINLSRAPLHRSLRA